MNTVLERSTKAYVMLHVSENTFVRQTHQQRSLVVRQPYEFVSQDRFNNVWLMCMIHVNVQFTTVVRIRSSFSTTTTKTSYGLRAIYTDIIETLQSACIVLRSSSYELYKQRNRTADVNNTLQRKDEFKFPLTDLMHTDISF